AQNKRVNEHVTYSVTAGIDSAAQYTAENTSLMEFKSHESLDLGFRKGALWTRIEIENKGKAEDYVIYTNDLINRTYRFYELNPTTNDVLVDSKNIDYDIRYNDKRSFNLTHANFRVHLNENSTSVFLIYMQSDGRVIIGDPFILSIR